MKNKWLDRQDSDPYVKQAKKDGYRSRAAYKLLEINQKFNFMHAGMTLVDLGAAPGGWSQVAQKKIGPKGLVVALDILQMDPIYRVMDVQVDFTEPEGLEKLESALEGRPVDFVLSDMAPNMSGQKCVDQARCMYLVELAMDFALTHLQPKGGTLFKVFQGVGFDEILKTFRENFVKVNIIKPDASRPASREVYIFAKGLKKKSAKN